MQLVSSSEQMRGDKAGNGVYERVKARIIAHEFPSGKRILIDTLADRLFVSHTPIREALVRLAAERLVNEVPKSGFFAKELSESEIIGLYRLQGMLLEWSLNAGGNSNRSRRLLRSPKFISDVNKGAVISPRTAVGVMDDLFVHITSQSGNASVIPFVRNINDRTHYVRLKDYEEFGDAKHLLPQLCQVYCQQDTDGLREGLNVFFRERTARLPELLRMLKIGGF